MIQQLQYESTTVATNNIRINLFDDSVAKILMEVGWKPLIVMTSMQTNYEYTFIPMTMDNDNSERYTHLSWLNFPVSVGFEDRDGGIALFGTKDRPYGLYQTNIYANTSSSNLDPSTLARIWTGLCNVYAPAGQPAIEYTEYETNDSDTNTIYITN